MFLVDGYNAIRRVAALRALEKARGLEAGREALLSRVLASGVLRSRRFVLVFDGDGDAGLPARGSETSHPQLSTRYAPSADDAIAALVSAAPRPDAVTVVTADRDLGWRVQALGAEVVAPDQWRALVPRRAKARTPRGPDVASDKPRMAGRDVDYWLEVFGDAEGGDRD